ncbi:MAG: Sir2 family NAD-dependent protein deacetylase [Paraburkholderia sp.]|uniref:SIR2 family NAD-dependent protein deacylase n=1 Tax=Paraburkholderia sp. TaxID=1926495 RepID=UPI003C425DAC
MVSDDHVGQAANWLRDADGLLITAGAGMGVDSGLPDFRGTEGLWREYPALKRAKLAFEDMANPTSFATNPALAWGFYGHRLALYRETQPHEGFEILRRWGERMEHGAFVFTSNVDGQFQKAGFAADRVAEVHGTIHSLQCTVPCQDLAWSADEFIPKVDNDSGTLANSPPTCRHCGKLARPNILMFGDYAWVGKYSEQQLARLAAWKPTVERLVVVELGAGRALPTVRRFSERHGPRVIRINLRENAIAPTYGIGIACGAKEALQRIDDKLNRIS